MDAKKHRAVGIAAGAGIAITTHRAENTLELIIEALAGAAGGALGAKLPDWAEPAVSSWHRGPIHSLAVTGTTMLTARDGIRQLDHNVQQHIAALRRKQSTAVTPEERQQQMLEILVWLAVVAFCKGVAIGYLSHVAMDATTPRGIPLLGV
jgi:membrane-bound metal-dependent hydrolase YbcI (DUF457 family)